MQRASTASGAPFSATQRRRPATRRPSTSACSAGSKWKRRRRGGSRGQQPDVLAERGRGARAARSRSGRRSASPSPVPSSALLHAHRSARDRAGATACDSSLASRSGPVAAVQTPVTVIRFSVSVPVLSVQMTFVEPECLDRAQALDERAPPGEHADADGQGKRDRRASRPSGTLATSSPIANMTASATGQPGPEASPSGTNAKPTTTATTAISQATRRTCRSSGLSSPLDSLRQRGDSAELGAHPGRVDDRSRLPAGAGGSAEDEVARLEQRARPRVDRRQRSAGPAPTRRSASTCPLRARPRAAGHRPRFALPPRSAGCRPARALSPR